MDLGQSLEWWVMPSVYHMYLVAALASGIMVQEAFSMTLDLTSKIWHYKEGRQCVCFWNRKPNKLILRCLHTYLLNNVEKTIMPTCCKQHHTVHLIVCSLDSIHCDLCIVVIADDEGSTFLYWVNPVSHLWMLFNDSDCLNRQRSTVIHTLQNVKSSYLISSSFI